MLSGALEAVWAVALDKSAGLSRILPAAVFFAALAASMTGLAYAMRALPVGTAYAVWVGVGAVLTAAYSTAVGDEPLTAGKGLFLALIIGGVVGLKLVG